MQNSDLVLIVDDDDAMRDMVRGFLELDGFRVIEAARADEMYRLLEKHNVSLILLDIGLPERDGLTIMREFRPKYDIPVIMLTGKGDVIDKIVGLELGADDYITKPFHGRELTARLKSVLRRSVVDKKLVQIYKSKTPFVTFNGWKLNLHTQILLDPDGKDAKITSHEFAILQALINSAGRVLTRDQLLDYISEGGREYSPFDRSLDVTIAKIRKKLGDTPKTPKFIRTVRQAGYMFMADIKEL